MADEITIVSGIGVTKGNLNEPTRTETNRVDMAGARTHKTIQTVGTTYEAMSVGDVATAGLCKLKNLDTTNYVQFGKEIAGPAFDAHARILPGETYGPVRLETLTMFLKANSAPCDVEVFLVEA